MASSEHEVSGPSGTSLRPTHEPSARRGRVGSLGRWVALAAGATVVATLVAVLLGRAGLSAGSGGTSQSWQAYHDAFGLFTLQVPPGWTAHVESDTGRFGDNHGGVTEREDLVSFADPMQGTGSARFSVFAIPLQTALAHQTFCRGGAPLQRFSPTTLGTLEQTGAIWSFTTDDASFQIDVAIPGVLAPDGFGLRPPPATPIPAPWVSTDKTEVNAMLVSFQPMDPQPLTC